MIACLYCHGKNLTSQWCQICPLDKLNQPEKETELSDDVLMGNKKGFLRKSPLLGQHSLSRESWKRRNCHMKQPSLSLDLKVPIFGSVQDFNCQCIPKSLLLALMNVWNCLLVYSLPLKKKKKKRGDLTIPAIVFSFCCFPLATGAYSF